MIPIAMTIGACIFLSVIQHNSVINSIRRELITVSKQEKSYVIQTTLVSNRESATAARDEISNEDVYELAVCICREAGAESEYVQEMVANVVLNRVGSEYFPDSIHDVITQPYQYNTMWRDGIEWPSLADEEMKTNCLKVARDMLRGKRVCPDNVIYQAEFPQGEGTYEYVSGIYFCY